MGRYTGLWPADGRFPPFITNTPGSFVHTDWGAIARASVGCSVISTAVKANVALVGRDRHLTGGVLRWKS